MRSCVWLLAAALAAGCVHTAYRAEPIVPEKTAAAFESRSLDDPGLRQFLAENLARDFSASAPADWDFGTLAWVAFYFNPALDVARAQWETARAAVTTAAARPNPSLVLTPGYATTRTAGVTPWMPAIGLDLPIETAGKRSRRADSARHAAEAARQSVFTAAWKVRRELRTALLDFSAAQRRAAALRAEADLQQRSAALLERRFRAGAIAAPELATARLAAARAEADAAGAAREVPLARQRIATALGIPVAALDGISLQAPAPVAPLSPAELAAARRQSLQSRPDILAALAAYDTAESALALEVARQTPDVRLGPGYQYDQGVNKWTLGLTFELPIFNQNQGPIAEAAARRHEAAAQFLATQAQAIAEIDAAAIAQSAAAAQLDYLRRAQRELEAQLARAESLRRAGAADAYEVAAARLAVDVGRVALVDAESQSALAAGQLEDALQIPFSHLAALESPPRVAPPPSSP